MRFWLGGYTADMDGRASGIGMLLAGAADDALAGGPLAFAGEAAAASGSPSWIARHPALDVVYAALEGSGAVQAFRRTGEATLTLIGAAVEAGDSVCHVAVAPGGGSLVASCWGDGRVVQMTLDAAGRPSAPTAARPASDPYDAAASTHAPAGIDLAAAARALREAAGSEYAHLVPDHDEPVADAVAGARPSRAHQAVFVSDSLVATTDMGLDLVRFWRRAADGLRPAGEVVLPLGSGPRHMARHPSGHLYVITELSHEVFVLGSDPATGSGTEGEWRIVGGKALAPGIPTTDTAAELCVSRDGEFLYAGLRGSDTIATLRVHGDGSSITPVALVEAGTAWPRHHVVVRDTLLVAGQHADEVVSLTLDQRTGVPGRVRHRTQVPTPTCLLPVG